VASIKTKSSGETRLAIFGRKKRFGNLFSLNDRHHNPPRGKERKILSGKKNEEGLKRGVEKLEGVENKTPPPRQEGEGTREISHL